MAMNQTVAGVKSATSKVRHGSEPNTLFLPQSWHATTLAYA